MNFADVTDITIPQGDLIKIHETDTGRVLWEKKKRIAMIGDMKAYSVRIISEAPQGYMGAVINMNVIAIIDFILGRDANIYNTPTKVEYPFASVGDKFGIYYLTPSGAKVFPDTVWQVMNPPRIVPCASNGFADDRVRVTNVESNPFITTYTDGPYLIVSALKKNIINDYRTIINKYTLDELAEYFPSSSDVTHIKGEVNYMAKSAMASGTDAYWLTFSFIFPRTGDMTSYCHNI